jgi:hypothetical protein
VRHQRAGAQVHHAVGDVEQVGVGVDAGDRVPADGARRPDDDAQRLLGDDL